jgi:8-oxo-dGTP pyrophosphatase MutT (NUDIX family)
MKYKKSCGAIIINEDKVLILQQVAGHWGFPKGHVEEGETEVETAKREIKEETNLDVEINDKLRYTEEYSPADGVKKEVVYFVAKKIGGEIKVQEEEVNEIQWLSYNEAMERLTYDNSKELLKKAWKDLNK